MKRVSILLPDLRPGGAERVGVNLANGLADRGYSVELVMLRAVGALSDNVSSSIHIIDLKVRRLRSAVIPLIRYIRKSRPDSVLACMWPLTTIALVARACSRVPARIIVAEHTTWSGSRLVRSRFGRWKAQSTMHLSFPRAQGIIAVSRGAADDLASFAKLERDTITVIYNPVIKAGATPPALEAAPPDEWWTGSHHRLLAVGTLAETKDYGTLLRAFAILRTRINAKLLILGEGDDRAVLEKLGAELNIEQHLFMPGFVKDVSPYYRRADLHVLSSRGEGLPTVIIEALAAGTPVVSTDCRSGPREILCDGKYGRLVRVGDPEALAQAMAEALTAKHDYAALKARAQDFSIEKAVDRYEELLFPGQTTLN